MLHIGQSAFAQRNGTVDRLDSRARQWAREVLETRHRVKAVLGYRAGCALATAVADAIAEAGESPPTVVLFDATTVTHTRTGTPLYLSSRNHELGHERNISLDVDSSELLTDPEVIKVVADLMQGARSWSN